MSQHQEREIIVSELNAGPQAGVETQTTADQRAVRMGKRADMLKQQERLPYPVGVENTTTIQAVLEKHGELEGSEVKTGDIVGLSGRVVHIRKTGKLVFAVLQAGDHSRLQSMLVENEVGEQAFEDFNRLVDIGDHIFVHGEIGTSRTGELSIYADRWEMASKSLRPLPNLHTDLSDEMRMRRRYVDLIVNPEAQRIARLRTRVIQALRDTFRERNYIELETPMLQVVPSGASARSFDTHMNAFDMQVSLRIAPELFLKRAVVGGLDRVFEINRNFRNEGADSTHSPEFTMLECYEAYADYNVMADLAQELIQNAAIAATGSTLVTLDDGTEFDLGGEWKRIDLYESISHYAGEEITPETSAEHLRELARKFEVDVDEETLGHGKLVEEIWEHLIPTEELYNPVFVMNYPVETSPLTRDHRDRPGVVEKWDLYIRGSEIGTAYSELADPVIQRERFVQQAQLAAGGDEDAMRYDEDFCDAMEYGFPPSGGMGIGIDRVLQTITGLGIRETILFPLIKPIEN
ncbi:lysine--tRNA ligase [Dermabacter sp. HMSC08H10]|uniref:lysine--tRNA ligase n=1 Tax=Dermabacter sp. HMSC08H10 TaxID=1581144 RepID=UPI000ADDE815|nr:lysine--tRNA ligase [Dermabacter sp. HMSC08H10]